uniref:GATA-type domain-containing protein n=1 Tax=Meloidogyne enterolobii TaxID=390850 RepID=A0A6V7UUP2_MELEN|nr:unnamed protein product [Meloidogyne enterolobii]
MDTGNKITEIIESKKQHCFNCNNNQRKVWHIFLKENYLCKLCGGYKLRNNGKFRSERVNGWYKVKKEDRHCIKCGSTKKQNWYRDSEPGQYLCNSCGQKRMYIMRKRRNSDLNGVK